MFGVANNLNNYIKTNKIIRNAGMSASFLLFVFALLASFPIVSHTDIVEAASPLESETTIAMNIDKGSANLSLIPKDTSGTFASSSSGDLAEFNVTTNNYTGYSLGIHATDDDGQLSNAEAAETLGTDVVLDSIPNILDSTAFRTSTIYNGKWGFVPSKLNSEDNTSFLPSPTTDGTTIDVTTNANAEANNYTIGLGARVDYTKPAGTYSNTFILTAVGNPVAYVINYTDISGDTDVTNMPDADSATSASTKVPLSTRIPARGTEYVFAGWCDEEPTINADGSSTCNGTVYQPSTESVPSYVDFINQTEETSILTLYATWSINSFLQTVEVRYQNTDGSWTNYEIYDACTKEAALGETYSCSIPATTEYQIATLESYVVEGEAINQIDVYRNTYTITVSNSNTTASRPNFIILHGGSATVDVTPSTGYYLSNIFCPSGFTCSGASTGVSNTGTQTVTVTYSDATTGGALMFAGASATATCYKQYRLQNADGSYPSNYTSDGSTSVTIGNNCTYSKTISGYNGNTAKTTSGVVSVGGTTLSLDFARNTYSVSTERGTGVYSITGGGTYRWGQQINLKATLYDGYYMSYDAGEWSCTSAQCGTFDSPYFSNTGYTVPQYNTTVRADAQWDASYGGGSHI